ncbi:hypothetical protein DYD21_06710 [Rhodohalobacter sp. SW132]|uniref:hypothetical protein n=1 Tax=Rhodohalobacter sp. SW132 TaxID=2293433 RepID=UPI000E22B3D5|nr:hypothetical protein [Rhodohalobacter sp. SW132]REL38292.1 hypothetical protein DYD21_06710 [Rhodohalobacter sp. SW132]
MYTPGLDEPLELILSTDVGEQVTVSGFQWWDFFPPEDLEEVFRNHASLALIGGKEENEDRGYAPCTEGGGRIVSEETIEMLAEWVKQKEGIENAYRVPSRYVINVYLKQEEITAEEIREIRDHPNFWFMEPAEGLFLKAMNQLNTADEENCSESIRQVFRLFRWEELEELLILEPGMVLTISYEQPDGSVLETSVNIVE